MTEYGFTEFYNIDASSQTASGRQSDFVIDQGNEYVRLLKVRLLKVRLLKVRPLKVRLLKVHLLLAKC